MGVITSVKGYFEFEGPEQDGAVKKNRKILWISCGVFFALVIVLGSIAIADHNRKNHSPSPTAPSSNPALTPAASVKTVCSVTPYPDSCITSISKISTSNTTTDPVSIFKLSLKVALDELASVSLVPQQLTNLTDNERIKAALNVCAQVFDDAIDSIERTVSATEADKILNSLKIDNLQTWLSSALTYHVTCLDALDEIPSSTNPATISQSLKSAMSNSTEYTTNSLAIVAMILSKLSDLGINQNHQRRLLRDNPYPAWVGTGVRRLLEDDYPSQMVPNVTVAADGSGDVKTVKEAVAKVPSKQNSYFHIYVKEGTYVENVIFDKDKWNVYIYGDGMDKTIISGSRSNHSGFATHDTPPFITKGRGFIMKDIGIKNTAGPAMGQAVAFLSDADFSVYYQCSFDAYQDTLYTHTNRQFYRNCDITGTVDFIFGNAAVVFQNCNIRPREPLQGQSNTITAQGRTFANQSTGISIQRCTISPNGHVTAPTYLGRPWKDFARTVIMETEISSIVIPEGWLEWQGQSGMFYGEYKNTGPGSSVSKRVSWDGFYKPVMTDAEAAKFNVATFIDGNEWLPSTGVPFDAY